MHAVLRGETIEQHNFLIPLIREGRMREGYFDFSYSPLFGIDGRIKGVMSIAAETTEGVLEHRRKPAAYRMGSRFFELDGFEGVPAAIAELVTSNADEFSDFALLEEHPGARPEVLAASSVDFSEFVTGLGIQWSKPVVQIDEDLVVLCVKGSELRLPRGSALVLKLQPLVALDREWFDFLYQLRREFIGHGKRIREFDRLERQWGASIPGALRTQF
ncbi:MAG: hypothetical protein U5O39_15220 [Gammaproteobacteria bacterium]|nr:hypothetical protein [Gammaproteobacteria bacterium]